MQRADLEAKLARLRLYQEDQPLLGGTDDLAYQQGALLVIELVQDGIRNRFEPCAGEPGVGAAGLLRFNLK